MDMVLEHVSEHQTYYIVAAIVFVAVLPLIYLTRRWSVPLIQYTIETIVYVISMHFAVGLVVRVAAWFKDQSSMKRAFGTRQEEVPEWTNPWLVFWDREAYNPDWLFWFELVAVVLIVFLVWRYRPMRVRRRPQKKPSVMAKKTYAYTQQTPSPRRGTGRR
ncbi:MAG: hypothetical protein ACLFTT_11630 [Candidatus Hydrogenedentota bacterium]